MLSFIIDLNFKIAVNGELIQTEIMMEDDLSDLQLNSSVLEGKSAVDFMYY